MVIHLSVSRQAAAAFNRSMDVTNHRHPFSRHIAT
jgi:hypothetical protein